MISKISSINLRKENIKHRIGILSVVLLCFAGYLIGFVMDVQNAYLVDKTVKFSTVLKEITKLSYPSYDLGVISAFAGVILALSAFASLHSKRQTDFYDALPMRRRQRLFLLITNDLVLFGVAMFVTMICKCIVVSCIGCFSRAFFVNSASAFVCYLAIFLAMYLFMALAVFLTGNVLTALLGFGVLAAYFPLLIRNIYPEFAGIFFKTYYSSDAWGGKLIWLSPVSTGCKVLLDSGTWTWKNHGSAFLILCLWIVVLLAADFWLYEKRSAESAGRSMAFPKIKPYVRVCVVIPLAAYTGVILYEMAGSERREWIVVGLIVGTMFFHGIIECIYRLDVRGMWAYKKQMLLTMCAVFLLAGWFWLDIGKYDEYVPNVSETASVLINPPSMGSDIEYCFWGKERKGVSGETMEHVLATLEKAVAANDENLKKIYTDEGEGLETYYFCYNLKNGQKKTRCYMLDKELQKELIAEVYDDEQYRKDTYSLYTADWSWVMSVGLSSPVQYRDLDITKKQRAELFQIYLDELSKLNYDTASTMLPCGQFSIEHRVKNDIYSSIVDYYDIYPTFKKTIAYIRDELNVDMKTSLEDIDIYRLEITEYDEKTEEEEVYRLKDREIIDSLKDEMCYGEGYWQSSTFMSGELLSGSVWAYVETNGGQQEISLSITSDGAKILKKHAEKTKSQTE